MKKTSFGNKRGFLLCLCWWACYSRATVCPSGTSTSCSGMISSYFSFDYHVENAECDEFSSNDFTDKKR